MRATLAVALGVWRGWRGAARRRVGGAWRLRVLTAGVLVLATGLDAVTLRAARPDPGALRLPASVLDPSLAVLFAALGVTGAALLSLTTPDDADLDALVAATGLRPGLRRLGRQLPLLALLVGLFVVVVLPLASTLAEPAHGAGALAVRLVGSGLAACAGVGAGLATMAWSRALLGRARCPDALARALGAAATLGGALALLRWGRPAGPSDVDDWATVAGDLLRPGPWTGPALLLTAGVTALGSSLAVRAPVTTAAGPRSVRLLLRGSTEPLRAWPALLLVCLREPTVALWALLTVLAPAALAVAAHVLALPGEAVAGLLALPPALLAAYPEGVTAPVRTWLRAMAPGRDGDRALAGATAVLAGGAVLLAAWVGWLVLDARPAWQLALLVLAVAVGWGHALPVRAGDPVSWFGLDLAAVVTSVAVCVLAVKLVLLADATGALDVAAPLLLAGAGWLVHRRRRGAPVLG